MGNLKNKIAKTVFGVGVLSTLTSLIFLVSSVSRLNSAQDNLNLINDIKANNPSIVLDSKPYENRIKEYKKERRDNAISYFGSVGVGGLGIFLMNKYKLKRKEMGD